MTRVAKELLYTDTLLSTHWKEFRDGFGDKGNFILDKMLLWRNSTKKHQSSHCLENDNRKTNVVTI